jgi:hypothetical protein
LPSFGEKVILGDEGKKKGFTNEKLISRIILGKMIRKVLKQRNAPERETSIIFSRAL